MAGKAQDVLEELGVAVVGHSTTECTMGRERMMSSTRIKVDLVW